MDEAEAFAQQKENCIFCKIVKGDVPGKKVYEDDLMIAVLDINPAAKGHVLVMPKEHYPILPMVPFEETQHMFKKTHHLIKAMQSSLLCKSISLFIANGGAAGQQSNHFLFHLIPREENDMFSVLDLPILGSKEENDKTGDAIMQRVKGMMQAYLAQTGQQGLAMRETPAPEPAQPSPPESAPEQSAEEEPSSDKKLDDLINVINENDDLKQALIERPDEVKAAVEKHEKWRDLFAGVDIDKLSDNLRIMMAAEQKRQEESDLDKISKVL